MQRSRFTQDPTLPQGYSSTLKYRFWNKVNKNGTIPNHMPELGRCWIWTGCALLKGYGQIRIGGVGSPMHLAHRVSWIIAHGAIPDGFNVLHKCDNSGCVRPDHLWIGTQMDNVVDMISKGRQNTALRAKGMANGNAKLTDEDVMIIRAMYVRNECGYARISKLFGVSTQAIRSIILNLGWKHLNHVP